jgi:7 transmembrane sweet-taste receptor of 3 GCPR
MDSLSIFIDNCELPCDPRHGQADANGQCTCQSTKWTGDDCSIEVLEDTNMLSPTMVQVCFCLVAMTFVIVFIAGAWVIFNRKRAQVQVAQPSILVLILVGCLVSTSTIIALAQEDSGDGPVPGCMAIPWLYSVGFSITFGSLFAKIQRVYKVMESATKSETARTIGMILLLDMAILLAWTIVDPLEWKRTVIRADEYGEPLESVGTCHSEHWKIFAGVIGSFHLFLLIVASYMCYLARHIPERFSNAKYIGISMFSNLQIMVIAIPVMIILGDDPNSSFFIRSLAIWINDFVIVSLIFGNLIFQVYTWDKTNKAKKCSSQTSIRTDIQRYAQKKKGSLELIYNNSHSHQESWQMENSYGWKLDSSSMCSNANSKATSTRQGMVKVVKAHIQLSEDDLRRLDLDLPGNTVEGSRSVVLSDLSLGDAGDDAGDDAASEISRSERDALPVTNTARRNHPMRHGSNFSILVGSDSESEGEDDSEVKDLDYDIDEMIETLEEEVSNRFSLSTFGKAKVDDVAPIGDNDNPESDDDSSDSGASSSLDSSELQSTRDINKDKMRDSENTGKTMESSSSSRIDSFGDQGKDDDIEGGIRVVEIHTSNLADMKPGSFPAHMTPRLLPRERESMKRTREIPFAA